MTSAAKSPYAGYRFPGEVISHAVWLYFRFPLSLRMVEEMLAARGIDVSHETVRQWARKFGQSFAPDPPPATKPWRQVASRRSVPDDRRQEALALAGRRPGWGRARRLGPEPAGQTGRQAPAPQAAEKAGPSPSCPDHGQARQLQRCKGRRDALGRAPEA